MFTHDPESLNYIAIIFLNFHTCFHIWRYKTGFMINPHLSELSLYIFCDFGYIFNKEIYLVQNSNTEIF